MNNDGDPYGSARMLALVMIAAGLFVAVSVGYWWLR